MQNTLIKKLLHLYLPNSLSAVAVCVAASLVFFPADSSAQKSNFYKRDGKQQDSAQTRYFRIINKEGFTEIKSNITPDEANRGYEILSESGRVLDVIAPAAARAEQMRKQIEKQYDIELMLKYSNLNDLEAERRRKLSEFDISISILKGNLTVLRENAERQRSLAASIERNGNTGLTKSSRTLLRSKKK